MINNYKFYKRFGEVVVKWQPQQGVGGYFVQVVLVDGMRPMWDSELDAEYRNQYFCLVPEPGVSTPIEGEFIDDDWSVSVLDSDHTGPILIVLNHPDVRLRLKVRRWQRGREKETPNQI